GAGAVALAPARARPRLLPAIDAGAADANVDAAADAPPADGPRLTDLIGRPAFPRAELAVAGGTLVIDAPGARPDRPYVHGVTLDGVPLAHLWLHHGDLARGGVLHFDLGDQPGAWGTTFGAW